ncbi:hypothetical protein Ga0074812_110142 [Parafrankia irregularis]|uniref:Uncharacterized protein n=1 Tax=Parafrankia irregularis TaxID=795642 RepID=A0A0S4QNA5_9ACTN|nr:MULTISPECIES: hypothetical protein [Parafrankia]MBE3205994.1 hypothetical protein [Parafrankia sp. CH37]CUU57127.1 hypothetical protein Ga0074812_110142 [Parafrankia irregularis]
MFHGRTGDELPADDLGPDDLGALTRTMADIEHLARSGSALAAQAEGQFVAAPGLVELADTECLDGPSGLRPWLDDLRAAREAGRDERDVAAGIAAWRLRAESTREIVRTMVDTNDRVIRESTALMSELRHRLEGFQVKAGHLGVAEEPELFRLHAAAQEALGRPPVDLGPAARLVAEYVAAVNRHGPDAPDAPASPGAR